jgi:hypothetical protein
MELSLGGEREGITALRALRAARRRHFVEQLDLMEALYRAYVVAIFGAIALAVLAGFIHDAPLDPADLREIAEHGPGVLGVVVAAAVFAGLRSGSRGGPLAIEPADLQHVLLAPVDRGAALRPAALRQLRVGALGGAVVGIAVGAFAISRLPGSPVEWLAVLAAFGAALPLAYLGPALLASGLRISPRAAGLLGAALLAWSAAVLVLGTNASPTTLLGILPTLPLQHGVTALAAALGVVLALVLLAAGLAALGGLSLDLARRRATLASELRFSASVQDLRTVVLLRRQLASELPRRRPWLRLGPGTLASAPIERRGLQSFLRWPAARVLRALAAGALTGAVAVAVWQGTTPLLALAGPLLFIAALDLVEPLAQELDHPTRRDLLPIPAPSLITRHLVAPSLAMFGVGACGVLVTAALGASGSEIAAAVLVAVPAAVLLAGAAALSATNDPYRYVLVPSLGYLQSAAPLAIAVVAVGGPLFAARVAVDHGHSPLAAVIPVAALFSLLAIGLVAFVGSRAQPGGGRF